MEINISTQNRVTYFGCDCVCLLLHIRVLRTVSNYLTGLVPAGPYVTNQSYVVRFCKGDSVYIEVIYTNGDPLLGLATYDAEGKLWSFGVTCGHWKQHTVKDSNKWY